MEERSANPFGGQFQRGGVPRAARLMAAEGLLPLMPADLVELWVHLAQDPDDAVRRAAEASLTSFPAEKFLPILRDPGTPTAVQSWAALHRPDLGEAGGVAETTARAASVPAAPAAGLEPEPGPGPAFKNLEQAIAHYLSEEVRNQAEKIDVVQKIYRLNTTEKLITALKGSREERAILLRDPNRLVATAVLGSPRVTEAEIESFSRMTNVPPRSCVRLAGTAGGRGGTRS